MNRRRWAWAWAWAAVFGFGVGFAGCSSREERLADARRESVVRILTAAALQVVSADSKTPSVLVVANPFAVEPGSSEGVRAPDEAGVRGVRRAVAETGSAWGGVVRPELTELAKRDPTSVPLPPGAMTPLSFMTSPAAWDRIREEHPRTDVWVSLIGVPASLEGVKAWVEPGGPKWALLLPDLRLIGGRESVRAALESRKLLAVVLAKPGAPPESEPLRSDPGQEFASRYVLVTRANLDVVLRDWPELIP